MCGRETRLCFPVFALRNRNSNEFNQTRFLLRTNSERIDAIVVSDESDLQLLLIILFFHLGCSRYSGLPRVPPPHRPSRIVVPLAQSHLHLPATPGGDCAKGMPIRLRQMPSLPLSQAHPRSDHPHPDLQRLRDDVQSRGRPDRLCRNRSPFGQLARTLACGKSRLGGGQGDQTPHLVPLLPPEWRRRPRSVCCRHRVHSGCRLRHRVHSGHRLHHPDHPRPLPADRATPVSPLRPTQLHLLLSRRGREPVLGAGLLGLKR